ncbi:MAG: histidine triad nucleotide-binding protein [Armatimonadetes bacterium]|nr:histidine triad nucleotide-binding protein [Armatimonadota bacterium]
MSDTETIFGRIIRGEIPCDKVYEDDRALAFRDLHPVAPTHILVIPKTALPTLESVGAVHEAELGHLLRVASEVARAEGLEGYRLVINNGPAAGQEVMHLHVHVLGGRGFGWPPG